MPTGRDLVLLEVMEAEHAAIGRLIGAVDGLPADPAADLARLGSLTDSLVIGVNGHLAHVEQTVLPLIQKTLTTTEWAAFEQADSEHGVRGASVP
uniref:hypothetical protein n=1 Tax=Paractinoplanes polyasparticus TaxID=2856853 RepID=UPI001C84C842|nr:hypothetical protein [Actinoplanes polyasparticus]